MNTAHIPIEAARPRLPNHRAEPIALPPDPAQASALVLRYVQAGNSSFDRSAAIEAMTVRVARLRGETSQQAEEELSAQAAVLDALFHRFSAEAVAATHAEHKARFLKIALQAQNSYTRTIGAIETLKAQRRPNAPPMTTTPTATATEDVVAVDDE